MTLRASRIFSSVKEAGSKEISEIAGNAGFAGAAVAFVASASVRNSTSGGSPNKTAKTNRYFMSMNARVGVGFSRYSTPRFTPRKGYSPVRRETPRGIQAQYRSATD